MKIITIIGARPQFIKAAIVSKKIIETSSITEILIHTGQHYDDNMSRIFFEEMGIPSPKYHLDVSGGPHGQMTGRMLEKIETTLTQEKPDIVLVYGDTNSTMAGSLAAAKLHIPIVHVEAGLRSFNRAMPEEINRVVTDHLSDLLLTPTQTATSNLVTEGISSEKIIQAGDVMYDAALYFGQIANHTSNALNKYSITAQNYILATIHRQENTDCLDRLKAILIGLGTIAKDMPVIIPLHPRTKARIKRADLMHLTTPLTIVPPLGYLDMVACEKSAAAIVTDSGGVQKEAFFYGVPCVTLRDETEWVELVESGWNRLVPPHNSDTVSNEIRKSLGSKGQTTTPYGEGNAAEHIIKSFEKIKI